MASLDADQARRLARSFLTVSESIADYLDEHFDEIKPADRQMMRRLKVRLADQAQQFTSLAIEVTLENLEPTLAHIGEVTQRAKDAVKHLADVRRAINIAAATLSLGTAIITGNTDGIGSAVAELAQVAAPQAGTAGG